MSLAINEKKKKGENTTAEIKRSGEIAGRIKQISLDTVDLETHDGQFVVRRPSKGLERIRARLSKYIDPGVDLQAELKAQRVEDAQRG